LKIHNKLNKNYRFRKELNKRKNKIKNATDPTFIKLCKHITSTNKRIQKLKDKLYALFSQNKCIRNLRLEALCNKNIISVFDSALTRTLNIQENTITTDILVVQTFFFDVLEDIILNGFMYKDEKYICFTASAGQIRTKKTVFIREKVWNEYKDTLTCGLSVDHINQQGGVNINKYLAYLALCNSATDEWHELDIDKVIVVEDMETPVRSIVDFIDEKTYQIERKEMDILINHTDGCGMILPRKSKKSFMLRMPWIKGLLVPFPFDSFIKSANKQNRDVMYGVVTDIYGRQHNILDDDIEVILTKSQFKMWQYYSSWDEYREKFKKYNCSAGICNQEEDVIGNAKLNYQMLQTLTDISDKELEILCSTSKNHIINIGKDRNTMLKVLGVTESNTSKNYLQLALEIYPELLHDTYSKEILKQVKKSLVRDARSGKIDIEGKYTFICPDLYAFCEYLIMGIESPQGLLKNGEVFCSLYRSVPKLDCLRSPHLYREHAVRENKYDREKSKWFITKGLYTSCLDPISKLLMFDNDGDKALVCADPTLIQIAERNMMDIVPLQYEMAKADAETITSLAIYRGLKAAYTGGNIGMISNDITKIWNGEHVNLDVIKWLSMENNFVIDYAKTLFKPTRPADIDKIIKRYTKAKTPYFFLYAKNKDKSNVEKINNSVINKLEKKIPNSRINFTASNIGVFDYKMLMSRRSVHLDQNIINRYTELDLKKRFIEINSLNDDSTSDNIYIYQNISNKLLDINQDKKYVVDVLIEFLYKHKKSNHKTTLWSCFGDIIIDNLSQNLKMKFDDGYIQCEECGRRIVLSSNNQKYCTKCFNKNRREYKKIKQREYRNKCVDI